MLVTMITSYYVMHTSGNPFLSYKGREKGLACQTNLLYDCMAFLVLYSVHANMLQLQCASGVDKGGPSRARPDQSSVVPYQMMLNHLPLYTLNICTYR